MLFYLIWIPILILMMIAQAWLSYKNNTESQTHLWLILLYVLSLLQIWPIVSKFSKDLFFDGLVFDIILFFSYTISALIFTGTHKTLNVWQVICLVAVTAGMIGFKLTGGK